MGELITALEIFRKDYIDPPIMTTRVEKDGAWLSSQLLNAYMLQSRVERLPLDAKYWACSKQEFQDWIIWDWTNKKKYITDAYDCENFAFSFKARCDRRIGINCVGLVIDYSGGHAYNVVVFPDSPAELYEPQNDNWVYKGQSKLYTLTSGYILI